MSRDDVSRKRPIRRVIRPLIDHEENEDELRRDSSGRKRVDVVQCLLDSSSDEETSRRKAKQNIHSILWLTLPELSHIRTVLAQTSTSVDQRKNRERTTWKFFDYELCDRCGKMLNTSIFSSSLLFLTNCFVCQQQVCSTCSINDYPLPLSTVSIPVRLRNLLQLTSISIPTRISTNHIDVQLKTVCYDCAQIFSLYQNLSDVELLKMSEDHRVSTPPTRQLPITPVNVTNSKITNSSSLVMRF